MAEVIQPQKGPQEMFLSTPVDLCVYGGAAGGGKTFALLLECLRHINNPKFNALILRRNSTQIFTNGGLWDNAAELYPLAGGMAVRTPKPMYKFPSGAKIVFGHLERYSDAESYQGSQIPLICCEESTLIRMADGTKKPLSEIQIGDMVETLHGGMPVTAIGNRRLEECVEVENEYGEKQIHSNTHKILTSSGWVSYSEMCTSYEFHQPLISSPIRCCDVRKSCECLMQKYLKQKLLPDSQCFHLRREALPCLSNCRVQGLQEISSCTALQAQENCCELSECDSRGLLRQILDRRFLTQISRCHKLEGHNSVRALFSCEAQGALNGIKFEDLKCRCLEDSSLYGEPALLRKDSGLGGVLILDGVVVRSRKGLPSDGRGKVRKRIHNRLQYAHPYTGEEQIVEDADIEYHSCKITPLGKRWVIDITVSTTNHYITESGLVNKNCFDELTHFDERSFWYMLSRNRSTSGIHGYIRATTNPLPDMWVTRLLDWYIGEDGYAIPERSGVIRYFGRVDGELIWGDTKQEVIAQVPSLDIDEVKSFTFIASSLSDNQILLQKDKGYLANLKALPLVEQERLLNGNWKIAPAAGDFFKRSQVEIVDFIPNDVKQWVRAWDLAATANEDADATASVLLGKRKDGTYIVADVTNNRMNASDVRNYVLNTAKIDKSKYKRVKIRLSIDPGQAGKEQSESYVKMLSGFAVSTKRESGDKQTRAEPVAAQWQHGNVQVLSASWNDMFFNQLEQFGGVDVKHDDMVDALANAFNELESAKTAYAPPKSEGLTKESYWMRG